MQSAHDEGLQDGTSIGNAMRTVRTAAIALCPLLIVAACGSGAPTSDSGTATAGTTSTATTIPGTTVPTGTVVMTEVQSGVAPAAVFFDASGMISKITSDPFRDIQYAWNFDDASCQSGSGTWTYGAHAGTWSRNLDIGPTAAHIYECSGTFHPSVTLSYGGVVTDTWSGTVTVSSADAYYSATNTICFSNGSTFSGCPSGATQISNSTSLSSAIGGYLATGKRLLFERGGTWTTSGAVIVAKQGPWTIGAYGSGAKPVFSYTGSGTAILQFSTDFFTMTDWRVMDVKFSGNGTSGDTFFNGGTVNQATFLRVDITGSNRGFRIDPAVPYYNNTPMPDMYFVQDSTCNLSGAGGANCVYSGTRHIALLGNSFDNAGTQQQTARIVFADRAVIAHNSIANAGSTQETLKLHGPTLASTSQHVWTQSNYTGFQASQYIEILDNKFADGNSSTTNGTVLGPQDSTSDERVRYVVVENNWFISGSSPTQSLVLYGAGHDVVRNNVFDNSAGSNNGTIVLSTRGIEPTLQDVEIYNNTFFTSLAQSGWNPVKANKVSAPIVVQNNLAYGPNTSGATFLAGTGTAQVTHDHNTGDIGSITANPLFVSTNPFTPTNARPTSGSYAIGVGASVPAWSDFFLNTAPSPRDLGAVNH